MFAYPYVTETNNATSLSKLIAEENPSEKVIFRQSLYLIIMFNKVATEKNQITKTFNNLEV